MIKAVLKESERIVGVLPAPPNMCVRVKFNYDDGSSHKLLPVDLLVIIEGMEGNSVKYVREDGFCSGVLIGDTDEFAEFVYINRNEPGGEINKGVIDALGMGFRARLDHEANRAGMAALKEGLMDIAGAIRELAQAVLLGRAT